MKGDGFSKLWFLVSLLNFGRVGMATNNWFKTRAIVVCCIFDHFCMLNSSQTWMHHANTLFVINSWISDPKAVHLHSCHCAQLDTCQALPFLRHARVPGRQLLWIIWAFRPLQTLKLPHPNANTKQQRLHLYFGTIYLNHQTYCWWFRNPANHRLDV